MQKVVILGAGESGVGAAILAKKQGFEVFVSDFGKIKENFKQELTLSEIPFEEQTHTETEILSADIVIKSPGIPKKAPIVKKILSQEIELISEIEWASRFTRAKIIAITGSNGKTTTTSLVYHILNKAGWNVGIGGNIGTAFSRLVLENKHDFLVIEVSSFQLDNIVTFKPYISILLNITPDHLDQYDNQFRLYAESKFRVTENQTKENFFVYNFDDKTIQELISSLDTEAIKIGYSVSEELKEGAFADNLNLYVRKEKEGFVEPISHLSLLGKHNIANSLAAAVSAHLLNVSNKVIQSSLSDFNAVPHRLEKVLKIREIDFINDSKATNVNAVYYALESMKKGTIWIVGGIDKGNDYSELFEFVSKKVKAIICLGKDNSKIISAFEKTIDSIKETDNMEQAVKMAYEMGDKGDTVLLSPACASFDLFKNYEDRGNQFKEAVHKL